MPEKKTKDDSKDKNKLTAKKKLLLTVALLLVVGLFSNRVWKLLRNPTDVVVIEKGTIEKIDTTVGYIIREEKVIKGENYKNGIVQIKGEGEKVSKGDLVFRYLSNDEEEIIKKIEDLNNQYQKALDGEKNIFSSDIKILDKQINILIEKISNTNNLNEITEYKKQLNSLITKKAKIVGEQSPAGSYVKELLEEKEEYEKKLNTEAESINADTSGIVSYKIDGYEDILGTEDFSYLTEETLENIELKVGQLIGTSSESGKIINNFKCYIVTIMNSSEANEAKEGQQVIIRLPNMEEAIAHIKYIKDGENSNKIIVFEIKNGVEYLTSYRKTSVDVIWWNASGLKVPNNSILKEGERNYIVRNRAGYTDKIPVKILKENDKYSLVDNYSTEELKQLGYTNEQIKAMPSINLYDEIIINPEI